MMAPVRGTKTSGFLGVAAPLTKNTGIPHLKIPVFALK
jgi:hypothetical protein